MTVSTKNWWKDNLFNVSTLIAMLTFIVVQARWQETVDNHMTNEDIHMKFERKIKVFVPRTEIENMQSDISDIKRTNEIIQKDIKELLKARK